MRLPGLVRYFCASVRVCERARARVRQFKRDSERDEGGCMYVDVWEAVILCTGVGVKADRMRIVIIIMHRI